MKNTLVAALLVAALGAATPARAQVFGQYSGAETVPTNGHLFGAYLNASDNVLGGLAQLRLSFYPNVDFGFQGGLTRLSPGGTFADRTTLRLGGDVRWQVAHRSAGSSMDVAVGAVLGVEVADNLKNISVGPTVVGSRTLAIGANGGLVPYAGAGFLFISRDAFGIQDSDISIPLRLGMEGRFTQDFRVVAELQLFLADRYNDNVGFATGVNLPF